MNSFQIPILAVTYVWGPQENEVLNNHSLENKKGIDSKCGVELNFKIVTDLLIPAWDCT